MYSPCMKDLVFATGLGTSIGVQKERVTRTPLKVSDGSDYGAGDTPMYSSSMSE